MMDRNREVRRRSMAAVNGGSGISKRRQQRNTNLRDLSEEDGGMEMQESPRLRDRGVNKDRDRDRDRSISRSKRRRGERLMHVSNREEVDDSSDESMDDDDDDDDEDASVAVRLPLANSTAVPSSSSSIQQQHQNHQQVRKSGCSAKPVRPPAASWKVADEMIGVSVPRKARSSASKRSQECWVSGGGGSGELIHRQASTSPVRLSAQSNTALSPSSSNASARKKKPISGTKHQPPKMAKSSASSIQEIEIEVAEVLYGMRGPPPSTNKQESNKVDFKDTNGLSANAKSRVSSPNSSSQAPSTSQPSVLPSPNLPMVATAPKRKRPRLKFDEESPTSPAGSLAPSTKMEHEVPQKRADASSPRSEKNTSASPAAENGVDSCDPGGPADAQQDVAMPESLDSKASVDRKEQGQEEVSILPSTLKEASCIEQSVNAEESTAAAKTAANGSPRDEKFSIDLMASPLPEKSSSDRDGLSDFVSAHKLPVSEKKTLTDSGEIEKVEKASKHEGSSVHQDAGNFLAEEFHLKKQTPKDKTLDLQLDSEKHDKDVLSLGCNSKHPQHQQVHKQTQQQKYDRVDSKQEKIAPAASLPLPVPIPSWPGGFPSFGYMGQVPSLQTVVPGEGGVAAAKTVQQPPYFLQSPLRPKRCATHCYIAQNISYHQQLARMNPFWSPAAAATAAAAVGAAAAPHYGPKLYNLNAVPPESAAITPKENSSSTVATNNNNMEAAQRKQFMLQQSPQPGSPAAPPSMIGPAFIFPLNQQPAVANRSVAPAKSTLGTGKAAQPGASASPAAAGSGAAGHSPNTVSVNYASLSPNDAQYMAILQNNALLQSNVYPFPIAAAHVGGQSSYKGAAQPQAMPFFNGPFYSSHIVTSQQQQQQIMHQQQQQIRQQHQHLQQIRQQHQHLQHPSYTQPQLGQQNPSTSSGSSSSQKHTHQSQQRVLGSGAPAAPAPSGSNSHSFPASKQQLQLLHHQARQLESETGCEDSPSTADSSRALHAQKGVYGHNFAVPMHSQNFALITPTSTALAASVSSGAGGGSHGENKQPGSHQRLPHQAIMSFASFGGAAAPAGAPGFDFSAIVQNPALLQNLPDVARHGYHIQAAAVAAAAQAAAQKKAHNDDGKAGGDSGSATADADANANANTADEEGKHMAAAGALGKSGGGGNVGQQHSLCFSRPDNDMSSFTNIFADANSRILNSGRSLTPPLTAAPATTSAPAATNSPSSQHLQSQSQKQQQPVIQFQKQQQQRLMQLQQQQQHQLQLQLQQQMSSRPAKSPTANTSTATNVSSDHLPAGHTMPARFSQGGHVGFPPSVIQGGCGAVQSPQWKASGRAAAPAPVSSATSSSSSAKNHITQQQQGRGQQQQPLTTPSAHQTQISFGVASSSKPLGTGSSNPALSSAARAATVAAGSPQSSVSKSSAAAGAGNSGSPRASSSSKPGQPPASVLPTLPLQQQQAAAGKNPSSPGSNLKSSSPITSNNRNMTSILGHPHISPSNPTSSKQQSQQQQQQQLQQSLQQAHLFFNNSYIQAQASQSNAASSAAGYYHQRRQSEPQPQQNSTASLSPSPLMLAGTSATSDPAKAAVAAASAAAATGMKGLTNPAVQYAAGAAASVGQHPFMSGPLSYIHTMPSSVKPTAAVADQKQSTAGN